MRKTPLGRVRLSRFQDQKALLVVLDSLVKRSGMSKLMAD